MRTMKTLMLMTAVGTAFVAHAHASPVADRKAVAALDTAFQAAVKRHDVATIERILHQEWSHCCPVKDAT